MQRRFCLFTQNQLLNAWVYKSHEASCGVHLLGNQLPELTFCLYSNGIKADISTEKNVTLKQSPLIITVMVVLNPCGKLLKKNDETPHRLLINYNEAIGRQDLAK